MEQTADSRTNSRKQLNTIRNVAGRLAIADRTLRGWITEGKLEIVRVGNRAIRIPESEVDRIIEKGTVPAKPTRIDGTVRQAVFHKRGAKANAARSKATRQTATA